MSITIDDLLQFIDAQKKRAGSTLSDIASGDALKQSVGEAGDAITGARGQVTDLLEGLFGGYPEPISPAAKAAREQLLNPRMNLDDPAMQTAMNFSPMGIGSVGGKLVKTLAQKAAAEGTSLADVVKGVLGQFDTTTAGRIVNKTTGPAGGYSVNLGTGEVPQSGLMMGKYANTDPRNLVVDMLRRADVEQHAATNKGALAREENFLGTWRDPDTGQVYLDVSKRFPEGDIRKATKFGERTEQKAGYNAATKETFPVGNWEDFVNSPEFAGRLDQMAQEGRTYLNQFPAGEWWDMHGGPFERVYGKENLPQVAGFTGSTAPNSAPRENLQTMSEYMRRFISGEPTLQPDWRVPEGMMTRQPGKQIGMEKSRAANLEKSEAGNLDALQKDKVREEAQALMGDPNAVVLDRHWARVAEDPSQGVYTAAKEGIIDAGKQYGALKEVVSNAARQAGRTPRDYSADVWTGIREHIKKNSDLFGQKFRGSAITGDSKSYADHFEDLIRDKAAHLGITPQEMEKRLASGDANLMSWLIGTPMGAYLYGKVTGSGDGDATP